MSGPNKILVAGVGNIFMGDDAFGDGRHHHVAAVAGVAGDGEGPGSGALSPYTAWDEKKNGKEE